LEELEVSMRKALATLAVLIAVAAPDAALADRWHHGGHGHRHGGHYWHGGARVVVGYGVPYGYGAPYGWGPYGYGGYGYGYRVAGPWLWAWPAPIVIRERSVVREPVYVERGAEPAPAESWYFCRSENAYYPDVERCPEPWIPVPPRSE
jgi:hypothetical protein